MKDLLSTNGLTKKFGRHKVVNAVNIHIRQGDIYGLIGRNGAGKTTILKMISGLVAPTEGDFSLFGKSGKAAYQYMSRIGTLIEAPGIYPNMSAYENMKLKCIAMGVRKQGVIEELLNTVGLGTVGKKKVKNFSLGMKQRLGIALALVGDPDLVILDEEKNITFIISSHILEELSKIATNYGIIHDGVLIKEMTREELLAECSERIELKTDDTRKACIVLENMGIHQYKVVDADTIQIFERLNDGGSITMTLAENGVKTVGITIKNEALEDYYLNLTGGALNV